MRIGRFTQKMQEALQSAQTLASDFNHWERGFAGVQRSVREIDSSFHEPPSPSLFPRSTADGPVWNRHVLDRRLSPNRLRIKIHQAQYVLWHFTADA